MDVIGLDGDFAAAARRIDDVGRHGVAGRMAAQPFDDFNTFRNGRAQMAGAFHEIALIEIVRAHANLDEIVDELALDVYRIVDARQQHALIAQRHAGARQTRLSQPPVLA